jgi:hypothetical protein
MVWWEWLVCLSDHRAVYMNHTNEILLYGGKSYLEEQPKSVIETWEYRIVDDMWYFNFDVCINNCSFQGTCHLGFCEVRSHLTVPHQTLVHVEC